MVYIMWVDVQNIASIFRIFDMRSNNKNNYKFNNNNGVV